MRDLSQDRNRSIAKTTIGARGLVSHAVDRVFGDATLVTIPVNRLSNVETLVPPISVELATSVVEYLDHYRSRHNEPPFAAGSHYTIPAFRYGLLRGPIIIGGSGAVLFPDARTLVRESFVTPTRVSVANLPRRPPWRRTVRREGTYISLVHLPWAKNNLYHWLVEVLPRLMALERTDHGSAGVYVLVPPGLAGFQHELLRRYLARWPRCEVVTQPVNEDWLLQELIFVDTGAVDNSGFLSPEVRRFLREPFTKFLGPTTTFRHRLYLSRPNGVSRRVMNEDELVPILERHRFDVFRPELLSFDQQVASVASAESLVGVHGSGMCLLLFAPEGCEVVALQPAELLGTHYLMLAAACGHSFRSLEGVTCGRSLDMSIDPGELRRQIEEIEARL